MSDEASKVLGAAKWFEIAEQQQDAIAERLRAGGGGGTSGGVTDDWKASVDRQLAELHGDVRALLYGLIAGFLFLIAAGGYAYSKLTDQQTVAQVAQAKTDAKIDLLVERTGSAIK